MLSALHAASLCYLQCALFSLCCSQLCTTSVQKEHATMSACCLLQGFQIVGGVLGALAALIFIPASWQR